MLAAFDAVTVDQPAWLDRGRVADVAAGTASRWHFGRCKSFVLGNEGQIGGTFLSDDCR